VLAWWPDATSRWPVAASHGVSRRFEDSNSPNQDGYGFPSDPEAFLRPSGVRSASLTHDLAVVRRPSMRFRAPPETSHSSPAPQRHRPPVRKDPRVTRPAMLPLLGFRALRHSLGRVDPLFMDDGSLRRRVPRARFGYLLRGFHHRSYRRAKRRSVHGLRSSRRSPRRKRCPSRGPCPPDVADGPTPRGEQVQRGRLQGLFPATSPFCRPVLPEGRTRPSIPS
jgi:hypothetical protein